MKQNEIKNPEIESFNEDLYDDFTIEELEQRLETLTPWICGANVECPNLTCGVDGEPEPEP